MPSSIYNGMAGAIFEPFKETAPAIHTFLPVPIAPPLSQTVDVIFNARHQEVDYKGLPFGDPRPVAFFRTDQALVKPKYGDEVTINSVDYMVLEVSFDGLQIYKLVLGEK